MKKIALLVALMMLVASVCACTEKTEETPAEPQLTADVEVADVIVPDTVGGWTLNADMGENITDEQRDVLDKALENYVGLTVKPIALMATQVVAGTNYAFLCETAPVVPDAESQLSVVVVYEDLEGNASVNDVRDFDLVAYTSEEKSASTEQLDGGWTVNADIPTKDLEGDAKVAFDTALSGLVGAGYTPVELLATQVVAGTNYAVLCKTTLVTATPITKLTVCKIYADLSGNATLETVSEIDIAEILG